LLQEGAVNLYAVSRIRHAGDCLNVGDGTEGIAADHVSPHAVVIDNGFGLAFRVPLRTEQACAGYHARAYRVDDGAVSLIFNVHEARQCRSGQNTEQQNYDHQFNDGKTFLFRHVLHSLLTFQSMYG
jgi:hypothetical protein